MKKIILYMTLCLIGMVQVACDQDIDGFDNSTNYIYFDLISVLTLQSVSSVK